MLGALTYIYEHSPEGRLPRNMGALFQRLVRALWKREGIRGATSEIPLAQVERAFAQLAYAMIDEDQPLDVPLEYALAKIGSPELLWAGVNASFAIIDGEYVRFFHQLMMEYFAAVELDQKDVSSVIVVEREKAWNSTPPGLPPLPPEERKKVLSSPRGMYGARWGEKWDQVIIAVCGLTSTLDVHIREIVGVDLYLAAEWLTSGVYFSLPLYDEILMMLLAEEENSPMHAAVTVFPLLVEVRETRVIAPLIKLLVHNNYHRVGSKVSDLLIRVGTEAVPQLIEALNDADSVMRTRVAVVLGAIRDERAVPVLIERLSDDGVDGWGKPRYVGDMAAMALKSIGTKEALDAFYKWRTDLLNTVHRMGSEADSRTLWSFQELLYWNRQEIRESLDVMFNNEMIVKLCENLTWTSIEILVTMGNSAVVAELERLLTIASDRDDDQMVETIINILNRIGTPEALRAQWAAGKG
jgi:HEAT repeat protein